MMDGVTTETIAKLRMVSVATLSTALFKKGLRRQVIQDVRPVSDKKRTMAGPAFTLRFIPAREDRNSMEVFRNPDHPQRKAIETCPPGHVLVMDSRQDANAATAGDILVTRLMKRGVEGIVTDGGFRDAMNIAALEIFAFHRRPSAPPNVVNNEAVEINVPIGCGNAPVFPGDIVVGDADGVIVVPAPMAEAIADEAMEMTAYEDFALAQVEQGETIIGLYPPTEEGVLHRFAEWRKVHGR